MARISEDTKIAGDFTVNDWKCLRLRLLGTEANKMETWQEAFNIFQKRIETRFLTPIKKILSIRRFEGEGFAAAALQCILVEFLEAFFQGKTYSPPRMKSEIQNRAKRLRISEAELEKHLQPHEYNSSAKLFRDFLTIHDPFRSEFTRGKANTFYTNIRCGLIHEAATKGASVIKHEPGTSIIGKSQGGDFVVNRTNFQKAIESFICIYRGKLLTSKELKAAFIRKMDNLCEISRIYYFAYGSNMNFQQIRKRVGTVYDRFTGFIKNYTFRYNKKSKDGSSKANIMQSEGEVTYGICLEIDEDSIRTLRNFEKGYSTIEVPFYRSPNGAMIIAKSFISTSISDKPPTKEYAKTIIEAAKENGLPKEYIDQVLTPKNL